MLPKVDRALLPGDTGAKQNSTLVIYLIIIEKRMRRTRHSSSRAPTRPETPVIFEPEASTGTGPGIFQRWRNPTPTRSTTPTAT